MIVNQDCIIFAQFELIEVLKKTAERDMTKRIFLIVLVPLLLWNCIVKASEHVSFPGSGVTLSAILYYPVGKGPFPAIIALHGCNGLSFRDFVWAKQLAAKGFIVILPDSFSSRGIGSQCNIKNSKARAAVERVTDALATKKYLQTRSDVKANAISLIGWSNGATTILNTVNKNDAKGSPNFAKAVAFYPYCKKLADIGDYNAYVPLLILMGAQDKIMSLVACKAIVKQALKKHQKAQILIYPGAGHAFDVPDKPWINPAARADVFKRVPIFLNQ